MYPRKLYSPIILWILWVKHIILLTGGLCAIGYLMLDWDATHGGVNPGHAVAISFVFLNFICEPTEMVLWSYHMLEPWVYLLLQALKSVLWTVIVGVGVDITLHAGVSPGFVRYIVYLLLASIAMSFYASLVYGVYLCVRMSRQGGYEMTSEKEEYVGYERRALKMSHFEPRGPMRPVSSIYTA